MSAPTPSNPKTSLIQRRKNCVARGVPQTTQISAASAKGACIYDLNGRRFLDFAAGIGVMSLGHSNPHVIAAVTEQAQKLQHVCMHIATYEGYVALCERLTTLLPHGQATKALLLNSGAEAVENAIKIARQATKRSGIICFTGAFHGRTLLGMSLTSKVTYKSACGPFAPEIYRLPFPDCLRRGSLSKEDLVEKELRRFRQSLEDSVAAENIAAVIIEPVLGEGGFVPAPVAYLKGLREICDTHGILLIFDEVQSGFCRTGAWGAYQRLGVTPDLSTWAKALGSGFPISAVVGRAEVIDQALPGTLGGTYGGNPVSCAAALATLQQMEQLKLCDRARELGQLIREQFEKWAERHKEIVDVRGLGAMLAMEFCENGELHRPAKGLVKKLVGRCEELGLLILSAGVNGNVLRILPPLTLTNEELTEGFNVLDIALKELCQ